MSLAERALHWVGIERRKDREMPVPEAPEVNMPQGSTAHACAYELFLRNQWSPPWQGFSLPDPRVEVLERELSELKERRESDRILNVKEVAAYLRVHPSTIYKLLREKKIPAFKMGSDWRFNLSLIDKWRMEQK